MQPRDRETPAVGRNLIKFDGFFFSFHSSFSHGPKIRADFALLAARYRLRMFLRSGCSGVPKRYPGSSSLPHSFLVGGGSKHKKLS